MVGRGAYVGTGVQIGDNVKLQNYALVYEPAELGDGVFVGPAVVLTNDHNPRSVDPDGKQKRGGDWEAVGVKVAEGASLGARSVCVAPVRIGRWAMVAAGAVVTKDVPDFGLVVGVPARQIGWVGRSGVRLVGARDEPGVWECPQTGALYDERDGVLPSARNFCVPQNVNLRTSTGITCVRTTQTKHNEHTNQCPGGVTGWIRLCQKRGATTASTLHVRHLMSERPTSDA